MATIHIKRKHTLTRAEVRDRVEAIARQIKDELDADYSWKGDTLHFNRSGASGQIDVDDDRVEFNIKLGILLSPLKGKIERTILGRIDVALADDFDGKTMV